MGDRQEMTLDHIYIYIYDHHKISVQSVLWGSRVVVVQGSMKVTLVSHEDIRTLIPISIWLEVAKACQENLTKV